MPDMQRLRFLATTSAEYHALFVTEELFTDINSLSYERKEKGCDLMFRL